MATIEIDETEVAALRGNTSFLQKLLNNPKTRLDLLKLKKAIDPETAIPEIDAAAPYVEQMNGVKSELQEMKDLLKAEKEAREKAERDARLSQMWSKSQEVARKQGYTGEALQKLEAFMEEKGIADHEIAIPAFERMHPPEQPVTPTGNRFDFFDRKVRDNSEDLKKLFSGDDEGFLQSSINDTLKQMRGLV